MNGNNVILHCQDGNSDKIYIFAVKKFSGGQWEVLGKWGRRGKNVSQQNKGKYPSKQSALNFAQSLANQKEKKGYVNIDTGMYNGPLTRTSPEVAKFLEPEDNEIEAEDIMNAPEPEVVKPKNDAGEIPKLKKGEVYVAKCVDNTGIEEHFDVGIDYIVLELSKGMDDEEQMVLTMTANGEQKSCYRKRFGKMRVE